MKNFKLLGVALAAVALGGCAHAEMTGDEHREAAVGAEQRAAVEKSEYDPSATATRVVSPRAPIEAEIEPMRQYNPTLGHLTESDRQMKIAFDHLKAAQKLDTYEDAACTGVSIAERTSCPLMAPHVASVEESADGVTLHLKGGPAAERLAAQMKCHLAFAKASDFVSVPCPLYVKTVTLTLRERTLLDIFSPDPKVAAQLRRDARKMFGETVIKVAGAP